MQAKQVRQAATPCVAYNISEFCAAHRISRSHFYMLVRANRGPRLMRVGSRTIVSAEAAEAWRREMELRGDGFGDGGGA